MARSGLSLAWADRPVVMNGARSIGRALFGLAVDWPVGLVEAESALGALVSTDLATLTEVEPSAALARTLANCAAAPAIEQAEPARTTRIARPVAYDPIRQPPLSIAPSTSARHRHLEAVPSRVRGVVPTTHHRRPEAQDPPLWRHLSTGAVVTKAAPLVGAPDLERMASWPHSKAVSADAALAQRWPPGERAASETTSEILQSAPSATATPLLAERNRSEARTPASPLTVEDGAREGRSKRVQRDAPTGQGLAALVGVWNDTNDDAEPNVGNEGNTGPMSKPPATRATGASLGREAVGAAASPVIDHPSNAAAHWDPVAPSDLDAEAMLLDIMARALRTEARRFGIEPDVGRLR